MQSRYAPAHFSPRMRKSKRSGAREDFPDAIADIQKQTIDDKFTAHTKRKGEYK